MENKFHKNKNSTKMDCPNCGFEMAGSNWMDNFNNDDFEDIYFDDESSYMDSEEPNSLDINPHTGDFWFQPGTKKRKREDDVVPKAVKKRSLTSTEKGCTFETPDFSNYQFSTEPPSPTKIHRLGTLRSLKVSQ